MYALLIGVSRGGGTHHSIRDNLLDQALAAEAKILG